MPQLSPMSWVFVFGVFLVFFIWFAIMVWWGNSGGYSVYQKGVNFGLGGVCNKFKWGFIGEHLTKLTKKN
uniref:ATP synthase F0 subunit 8 n=1 Tax=Margaritifera margaritifera TaxID=2505931 RepID=A0A455ZAL3_9BIVA|nr:ATP synthase F0 subunit 8 [Margaritifera margaritifera]QCX42008.1 ATP synthase F0 subunit 8 [Margaritifera margaritifera]QCX42021.1 ATP synthase F0 subunit 8 [Margaritifera margaritifera]QCX42034.1 ATP synthase F0 subunit 8 [Margaritifera margaritifera]QRW36426.1 ATP synthase F0 subunit 8 [Margaritifera margaritifera]DAC74124.1 TPA_inf: ATP synthase F0 subunit 8 [Margaritifera margaritifera]